MRILRVLSSAILFLCVSSVGMLDAQVELRDDFQLPSARTAALGGLHSTNAEDISVLFSNPAGLASTPTQFSLSKTGIRLSGPVFALSDVVIDGLTQDLSSALSSGQATALLQSLYAAGEVVGPLHFGYVGDGLGFGVFNATSLETRAVGTSALRATASARLILQGGYAFPVRLPESWNSTLDFGVVLKGLMKGESRLQVSLFELPVFVESIGENVLQAAPFAISSGIGLDLGARFALGSTLVFGLVGRDVFSPTVVTDYSSLDGFLAGEAGITATYGYIPFDLTAGIRWMPRLGLLERVIDDVAISLDYKDILDFALQSGAVPNPLLKIGFGAEVTTLEILSIRGGFSEGLFAAGIGVDLTVMELGFAMYGSELSLEPGLRPTFNVALDLELGF